MRYLKTYDGVITGSFMGRDDGYPETKYEFYDNIEDMAKSYGSERREQFFEVSRLNFLEIKEMKKDMDELKIDTKEKLRLITDIVERADELYIMQSSKETLTIDLVIADEEFDLKLEQLLFADDFNFIHEVVGIQQNVDRENKKMNGEFIPRYAGL